jgi:hypothetical protein
LPEANGNELSEQHVHFVFVKDTIEKYIVHCRWLKPTDLIDKNLALATTCRVLVGRNPLAACIHLLPEANGNELAEQHVHFVFVNDTIKKILVHCRWLQPTDLIDKILALATTCRALIGLKPLAACIHLLPEANGNELAEQHVHFVFVNDTIKKNLVHCRWLQPTDLIDKNPALATTCRALVGLNPLAACAHLLAEANGNELSEQHVHFVFVNFRKPYRIDESYGLINFRHADQNKFKLIHTVLSNSFDPRGA